MSVLRFIMKALTSAYTVKAFKVDTLFLVFVGVGVKLFSLS